MTQRDFRTFPNFNFVKMASSRSHESLRVSWVHGDGFATRRSTQAGAARSKAVRRDGIQRVVAPSSLNDAESVAAAAATDSASFNAEGATTRWMPSLLRALERAAPASASS